MQEWLDERLSISALSDIARKKEVPVHRYSIWYYFVTSARDELRLRGDVTPSGPFRFYAQAVMSLYGTEVKLQSGQSVIADENYLRESILNSTAKVVAGYQPIMPSFRGQLSEEQVSNRMRLISRLASGDQMLRPMMVAPPAKGVVRCVVQAFCFPPWCSPAARSRVRSGRRWRRPTRACRATMPPRSQSS